MKAKTLARNLKEICDLLVQCFAVSTRVTNM